jgi:hypothetical protein
MKRIILAAIAAMLMLASPAQADTITIIVDITVNPFYAPDGMALYDLAAAFDLADPYSVGIYETAFDSRIAPGGYLITSVTDVPAVPEPATWAMILLGFAGLGFAFRQSRRKVSFA